MIHCNMVFKSWLQPTSTSSRNFLLATWRSSPSKSCFVVWVGEFSASRVYDFWWTNLALENEHGKSALPVCQEHLKYVSCFQCWCWCWSWLGKRPANNGSSKTRRSNGPTKCMRHPSTFMMWKVPTPKSAICFTLVYSSYSRIQYHWRLDS